MGFSPKLYPLVFLLLSFLAFSFSLSSSSSATQLCSNEQAIALLQFKNSISINKSTAISKVCESYYGIKPKTESWKEGTDCCSWDGITCDNVTGNVLTLNLSCSSLYGSFPSNSSLFLIKSLQSLNLSFNYFKLSKIPREIGQFVSLKHLDLSLSGFSGQVPNEISHLSKLVSLNLSYFYLYSELKLEEATFKSLAQNLSEIRELILSEVNLSSLNARHVMNLSSSLTDLDLSFSDLKGKFPHNILRFPNLKSLTLGGSEQLTISLSRSNLSSPLEFLHLESMHCPKPFHPISKLKSLKVLSLIACNLEGSIPSSIGNLSQLSMVDLSSNNFGGLIPPSLTNLTKLTFLSLSYNLFSGPIPFDLGRFSELVHLDLSFNLLNGTIPSWIFTLSSLEFLSLRYNQVQGPIPSSITNLVNLTSLDLSSNGLNGTLELAMLSKLQNLEYLDLSYNNLSLRTNISVNYTLPKLRDLHLSSCDLSEFPNFLRESRDLEYLDLSNNNVSWRININVNYTFPKLQFLSLSSSSLSEIPIFFRESSDLKGLGLSNNNMSWRTNINVNSIFPKLQSLYLSSSNLSEFPNFLRELSDLEHLDLSNNIMSWTSINVNCTFPKLQYLFLSSSNLSEFPNFLRELSDLKYLDLSNNNVSWRTNINVNHTFPKLWYLSLSSSNLSEFPSFLKESSDLESLDLSNNRIEGQIPEWMWNVGKDTLRYLDLSHNFLMALEQIPWRNIENLDIRSNMLRGVFPIPPIQMIYLFISNNNLSGEISSELCKANSLEILDLSHNNLSGMIPNCLPDLSKNLSVLNLQANRFHGNMPSMFPKGCRIQNFNLRGNQMEGLLPRSLVNCSKLEVLDISNNNIKDTFPYWLESLPKLQVLILRSNKFHGLVHNTKANSSFPKLRVLDLSNNNFVGLLPVHYIENLKAMVNVQEDDNNSTQYMGGRFSYEYSVAVTMKGFIIELEKVLTIFTSFDLSKNKFVGEIPKVIGRLKSLKGLNLSHNNFNGSIPHSLGNLTNLEWLDLSSNELVGEIPQELVSLTSLSVLDLSNNQLDGCIPQGNQFNTFGNSSYEGNPRLYGFPLTKSCDKNEMLQQPPSSFHGKDHELWEIGWRVVLLGYGCGLVFGLLMGHFAFQTGKPKWFVTLFDGQQNQKARNVTKA